MVYLVYQANEPALLTKQLSYSNYFECLDFKPINKKF